MKKILAAMLSGAVVLAALGGCGTYTDDGTSSSGSSSSAETSSAESGTGESTDTSADTSADPMTFTFIGGQPVTLNPILSQSTDDGNSFYLLQSSLFRYTADGVQNEICETYDVSDDGLTYTFHLRDANWSDGEPITAEHFAYALYCYTSPDMGCPQASGYYDIAGAEAFNTGSGSWEDVGVKAIDDKTLEITLTEPNDDYILQLATSAPTPLRQDFVEAQGESLGSSVDALQYSGPYVLTEWVLDSSLTFTKNLEYWNADESFPVETITLLDVDDANTAYSMFESGEVDALASVSTQYKDALADYTTIQTGGGGMMYIWINENGMSEEAAAVLSNQNFRNALNYAIDRSSTVAAITPLSTPYSRLTLPFYEGLDGGSFADEYPVDCPPLEGDVEQAQEYLALALEELGMSSVAELPEMHFVTWDTAQQRLMCETLIDQWKQNLGIETIQLDQYPIGTAIGNYSSNQFDIFAISISSSLTPYDALENFVNGGDYNNGIWTNDEYDALVEQVKAATDKAEKYALTQQAEQILVDGACIIPFYGLTTAYATQDYVEGFAIGDLGAGFQFENLQVNK
ncbi:MAG TPA: peptide ABC transporter substrate-binding protein [Candidatus Faecivivens stercoravium]|uniref:Peptide ABC transporter substrate-binding protein n=1 Tax=Candidatus Faecivivens stercoravium TaxID=2840803 RepID=A0A9D1DWC4_9FIRM|nr:peptide ABC transporter substrate-binding protein [Candidatus Faecivivens stercoravium]